MLAFGRLTLSPRRIMSGTKATGEPIRTGTSSVPQATKAEPVGSWDYSLRVDERLLTVDERRKVGASRAGEGRKGIPVTK
jgi:hypothetical protein